jgi:hypothetical protein
MSSSLELLAVGYPDTFHHSLTGISQPLPLVPAGPTTELWLHPQLHQLLLLATHFFLSTVMLLTAINRLLSVLSSWAPLEDGRKQGFTENL